MVANDFTKSEKNILSIRLSTDGFSFSVYNPEVEDTFNYIPYEVDETKSMTANVKDLLTLDMLKQQAFGKVNILLETSRFTTVPLEMYDDDYAETLFYSVHSKPDNEIVLCNILGKSNVALLFGMNEHTYHLLTERYPKAKYFATISPLIEYFFKCSQDGFNRKLYAYLQPHTVRICAFDHGRLQLANTFECDNNADRLYYLLYVCKQLGFNAKEDDELYLTGSIKELDGLTKNLERFISNVQFIYPKAAFQRAAFVQENVPFDLQALLTCE